jgi:hypothetical protein
MSGSECEGALPKPPSPPDGFWDWLEEPIWPEGRSRRVVLTEFVRHGILPFVKSHGYVLAVSETTLLNWLANGLYDNRHCGHVESRWQFPFPNTDWLWDDLYHWEHIISDEEWEIFWRQWGHWEDVDLDFFRGSDRRQDVEALIWKCIDISKSEQTKILDGFWEYEEETGAAAVATTAVKGSSDVYLQEAEGWGGYRR